MLATAVLTWTLMRERPAATQTSEAPADVRV